MNTSLWMSSTLALLLAACASPDSEPRTVPGAPSDSSGGAPTEPNEVTTSPTDPANPTAPTNPSATNPTTPTTPKGHPIFPADNAWNTDISSAPVDANSDNYINSIGRTLG